MKSTERLATTQSIVAAIQARGSDATDFRDAVHEACHALECWADPWDRDSIHEAVMELYERPADRVASELLARAVEKHLCESFGVDYDVEKWALMAAMESVKGGISLPLVAWIEAIQGRAEDPRVSDMAMSIENLALIGDRP